MCREGEERGQCRAPESICPALGLTAEVWDSTYGSQWVEEKEMKKAKSHRLGRQPREGSGSKGGSSCTGCPMCVRRTKKPWVWHMR